MEIEQKIKRIKYLEEFLGAWNGEDNEFMFEGSYYTEDDWHKANDELEELRKNI